MSLETIHISANYRKRFMGLFGALAFVLVGAYLIYLPAEEGDGFYHYFTPAKISGWASILFFGSCTIVMIYYLKNSQLGLLISDTGITDYSSPVSAGFIPWSDVLDLQVIQIEKQRLILILVQDSDVYINRQKNKFKKGVMQLNDKYYGTPIHITANGLKIKFNELEALLFQRFKQVCESTNRNGFTIESE